MKRRKKGLLAIWVLVIALIVTACAGKSPDSGSNSSTDPGNTGTTNTNTNTSAGDNESAAEDGPFTKFDPSITLRIPLSTDQSNP